MLFFIFMLARSSGQDINHQLKNILDDNNLIGMSALAVCNDSVVYLGSFGTADFTRNIPVTDSTMFRIASISKTVAATALMILYEQGLFKLDDDISNILGYTVRNPNYPEIAITPRMLLSHTSSIQDGSGYMNFIMDTYKINPPPVLSKLLTDTGSYYTSDLWQNKIPGTYFSYSNLNFGIIGTMVEKLSGQRYDIFCRQHIFDPLGITGSYRIQDVPNINNVAVLYRAEGEIWIAQADNFQGVMPKPRDLSNYVTGSNGLIYGPHASLRISARDLSKFMCMQINGGVFKGVRILQDSTIALMHKPQWTYNGSNGDNYYGLFRSWGLGFQITKNIQGIDDIASPYSVKGHIGESYGLVSDMFFNEENKFGMIFLTNGSSTDFDCGSSSDFYKVEENVLTALYNAVIQPCLNNSVVSELGKDVKSGQFVNPSSDNIYFRYYLPTAGDVSCIFYNSIGQQVSEYKKNFDSYGRKQISVNTKGLGNGLYYCIIQSQDNRMTLKFNIIK